jgi:hypothetical protein
VLIRLGRGSKNASFVLHPPIRDQTTNRVRRLSRRKYRERLNKLFKACNEEERLWFEFFLMTGMREQVIWNRQCGTLSPPEAKRCEMKVNEIFG